MINMFRAEMLKLTRRRTLVAASILVVSAAMIVTTVVFLSAEDGGTEAFSVGMSFTGVFVLVIFVANWAGEFLAGHTAHLADERAASSSCPRRKVKRPAIVCGLRPCGC